MVRYMFNLLKALVLRPAPKKTERLLTKKFIIIVSDTQVVLLRTFSRKLVGVSK